MEKNMQNYANVKVTEIIVIWYHTLILVEKHTNTFILIYFLYIYRHNFVLTFDLLIFLPLPAFTASVLGT